MASTEEVAQTHSPELWAKSGPQVVDRDEPLFRIVVLREPANARWSLLVSMSHVVGDGYTFYMIHNMLGKDACAWPMETKRVCFDPVRCLKDAPFHGKWLFWILRQTANQCGGAKKGNELVFRSRYVRSEWLEEQKSSLAEEDEVPFVSANDLLTSWFFQATQPACRA